MSIYYTLKCDNPDCGERLDVPSNEAMRHFEFQMPASWYRVKSGPDQADTPILHFCSANCVAVWARVSERQRSS